MLTIAIPDVTISAVC